MNPTNYTIKFSAEQLQTVANALQEMPFRVSASILQLIQEQVNEQNKTDQELKT